MVAVKKMFLQQFLSRSTLALAVSATLAIGISSSAQADVLDSLIDKLKEKGVITEDEYHEIKDTREGEKAVLRRLRRDQAEKETLAEERAKTEVRANFSEGSTSGITFESADKQNFMTIGGRIQGDYRNFSGDDALLADTFDIRRAYLTVAGRFWDYYTFDLSADFAGLAGSNTNTTTTKCSADPCTGANISSTTSSTNLRNTSHLDVAWFNVNWWQSAQFRFGQFKMPMSIEEQTSSRFLDFQERSIMNQFVPAKERGFMLHGTPTPGLFYGLALSAGQGKNNNETDNNVDGNDYIGRVGVNVAEMVGQKNAVYHLAAAYSSGSEPIGSNPNAVPGGRTEGRGISFFSVAGVDGADVDRTRTGLEAAVAYGPVKFQGEYLKAKYSGKSAAGVDYDRGLDVWYAGVNWLITGETYADTYKNGAFGRIRPKANFSPKGAGWGAWELGLRYTNFDASDFKNTNAAGTGVLSSSSTNKAKAYTLGVKWIPTPNTRFLLNYVKTDFDTPVTSNSKKADDEKAITFRAQFDF